MQHWRETFARNAPVLVSSIFHCNCIAADRLYAAEMSSTFAFQQAASPCVCVRATTLSASIGQTGLNKLSSNLKLKPAITMLVPPTEYFRTPIDFPFETRFLYKLHPLHSSIRLPSRYSTTISSSSLRVQVCWVLCVCDSVCQCVSMRVCVCVFGVCCVVVETMMLFVEAAVADRKVNT